MTVAMSCPDRASLERLLDHGAGPDEVERLAGHLETCGRCGETVETLLAADRNAAALRGTKVEADAPSVQLLRARLANLRAAPASQDTTTGGNTRGAAPSSASAPFEATKDKSVSLAPPQQPDEIGRLGGYRILKELGRGGMGVVYQAEDPKLKRLVALKAMLPGLAADDAARQRFLREAQAMAAVHHDHVVTIHAVDEANGVPFLAMEFLQGMPMDQWLKGGRKPSIAQLLRLGREIAEGLAAAHERGLIHRDIKPGNIWLDSSHKGRVKILDFGLARSGQEDVHLTRTGAIVGTPAYMAPEQARGEKVDARGDLFSLGCVLYRLCTGTMPFAGNTTTALLMALALDTPKSVRDLNSDVPPELADLVTRLLEKEPAKRPQSAREVIQALQAVTRASASAVSTATVSAVIPPAPTPAKSAPGGRKRRPWIVAAVAAGFLATAIAVAIVVIIRDKNGDIVATINAPPGGSVDIHDEAKKNGQAAAPKPTVDDAWVKQVAAFPAEQQVDAVAAKLKELNPGFDGKVKPTIEGGGVVGLEFVTDNVTDISPLRALPELKSLNCRGSADVWNGRLADLSPLKGMALTALECGRTRVSDLSPVKGMPLKEIWCDFKPERDAELLRSITTLEKINGKPAADFWKDVEAQQTAFDAWLKQVAALPADKQAEAVTAKLKELNPGFDGKVTPTIENGVVVGLLFVTDNLTDVSPVRVDRAARANL